VGTSSDAAIEALKQNDILKAVLKQHGISLPASVTATPAAEDPETGVTQQTQASPPGDCSLSDPELAAAIQQSMLCSSATPPKVWNNRAAGDRDGDCGGRVCLVVDKFGERRKNNARFEVYSRCEKKLAALQASGCRLGLGYLPLPLGDYMFVRTRRDHADESDGEGGDDGEEVAVTTEEVNESYVLNCLVERKTIRWVSLSTLSLSPPPSPSPSFCSYRGLFASIFYRYYC
jgi:hypothetical protein